MADPTLRLTFTDLRIRVAEFLGVADYSGGADAALPSDAHDLALVGRLVNDGYRRFITENEKWNFLTVPLSLQFVPQYDGAASSGSATTLVSSEIAAEHADDFFNGFTIRVTQADGTVQTATVTDYTGATGTFTVASWPTFTPADGDTWEAAGAAAVEGQNYRMFLPGDFYGLLLQPFTYEVNGPYKTLKPVSESTIRAWRAGQGETTGDPAVYAIRAINTTAASDGNRWEVLFWPAPSGTQTITAVYKRFPNKLSATGDTSVAGFQHDETVLAAALAAAELQRGDAAGPREESYQKALTRSRRMDARAAPERVQDYGDRSEDGPQFRGRLPWGEITTYNGETI